MTKKSKIDAIILSTTFGENVGDIISFLKKICLNCLNVKRHYNVFPVFVFEKSEIKKYDTVLSYFENYQSAIKPILLKNNKGTGFSSCLNFGIFKTNSKWILRIDTDDELEGDRIINQLGIMKKEDLDISYGYMKDQKGEILKYPRNKFSLLTDLSFGLNPIAHPTVCIKRESLFLRYNENQNRCEDFELWINLFIKEGIKSKCITYPLTLYNTRRSYEKDSDNAKTQIKIRLKYGFRLLLISISLFSGIFNNLLRLLFGNNILLKLRRKLNRANPFKI
tara:strand:+ start:1033 stop:1869 length:837 start_codon:yes stop_codon:yes gene_type:complete